MLPTADYFGKIIDCRYLVLEGRFFFLSEAEIRGLAECFYSFVETDLGESSIILWKQNEKTLKGEIKSNSISLPPKGFYSLEFYGDKTSSTVYDKRSLRSYEKTLDRDPVFTLGLVPSFASADYPEAAKKLIDNSTPISLRNSLLQLFSIEGKINKSLFDSHDMQGYLLLSEMIGSPRLFSGGLVIKISTFCADKSLDLLSEALLGFGTMLSLRYSSINVSVGIRQSSIVSDYERYFGGLAESCRNIPDALIVNERAKYLYLHDVGWANIISPAVCQIVDENLCSDCCTRDKLVNGALVVRAKDNLSDTSLAVLKEIKRTVYSALFPGESEFPRNWPYFRAYWENLPVFDDELFVSDSMVHFRHTGSINRDYILSV